MGWEAIILALPALGSGLFGAWRYFSKARALADTPTARIRSAQQGYVELKGRAALLNGPPIIAPLSGLPCVWYRFRVEEKQDSRWETVDEGSSDALFLLKDTTGRCVVDPDGAEFIKTTRDVWYGDRSNARTFALWGMGAHYRNTEQRIIANEELYVIGLFKTVGSHQEPPDTRREVAHLLENWKKDSHRMASFDQDRNGRIDLEEWEAARRAAHREVQEQQLARFTKPEVNVLSNPNDWNRPFLISTVRESRLIRSYQLNAALFLLIAMAAGSWLAWAFA